MEIPSNVRFVDEKMQKAFEKLQTEDKEFHKQLEKAFLDIEKNAFCGIQIPKRQIPNDYVKDFNVTNLWKYNLPEAWRLLYYIENQDIFVVSIILEWMSHKEYERKFKY